jgi:YVTN family beta-propeller protein
MPDDDSAERTLRELLRDQAWSLPSWPDAPSRIRRAARRQRLRVAGLAAGLGAVALAAIVVPVSQLGGGPHRTAGVLGPAGPATAYVLTLSRDGSYGDGNEVTPISVATNKAGRPVRTPGATEMVAAPDGRAIYVNGTSGVTVISTATNRVVRFIRLRPARQMAITPDGKTLYVCSGPAVVPVSTATGHPGRPIQVSRRYPRYVAVTPDGRTAYVTTNHSDEVSPIQVATGHVLAPVDVGGQPGRILIAPAGHIAYFGMKGQITPVDTSTGTALKPIRIPFEPGDIAFSPDARTAYVSDQFPPEVIPIRVATGTALPPIKLPGQFTPLYLAISPDGKTVYASMADMTGNLLLPISTVTRKAQAPVKVGYSPYIIAVTPDGSTVYVGESALQIHNRRGKTLAVNQPSQVMPVRTATNQPGRPIKVAGDPAQIVISP